MNIDEVTDKTKSVSSSTLAFPLLSTEYLYLGFKQPFTTRYFHFAVPNAVACELTVEFWTGSDWKAVEDLVDETRGFRQSGFLSWLNFGEWDRKQQTPIVAAHTENGTALDLEYYWVRIQPSEDLSAETELQSVVNLFCNDALFGVYYSDILADSRYLPAGRSNFMEHYFAAKDHVVRRMRQMGKITDEGDLIDITDVAVAACHATAYIILNPIARDDEARQAAKDAFNGCEGELSRGTNAVDTNKDGKIDAPERFSGSNFLSR
jgi:hypothetical protein